MKQENEMDRTEQHSEFSELETYLRECDFSRLRERDWHRIGPQTLGIILSRRPELYEICRNLISLQPESWSELLQVRPDLAEECDCWEKFPAVDFTDCYMNPIMRKSGLTPDQLMRRQLYSLLRPTDTADEGVNILGCNLPTDKSSDLVRLIEKSGHFLRDITLCRSYDEYQEMARSGLSLSYLPPARAGGDTLAQRLGRPHLYLPLRYGSGEIRQNMDALARALGTDYDGGAQEEQAAMDALRQAARHLGDIPIAIDYTATPAPLGLARLLLSHGFTVRRIFLKYSRTAFSNVLAVYFFCRPTWLTSLFFMVAPKAYGLPRTVSPVRCRSLSL